MTETVAETAPKWSKLWQGTKAAAARDFKKWGASLTSITNIVATGAMVWYVAQPIFAHWAVADSSKHVAQLEQDLANAIAARDSAQTAAAANKQGYDAAKQDNAELAKANDELRQKLEASIGGEGPKAPLKAAAADPPIHNVKTKTVSTTKKKKEEPTTWEQFVAWYETNVGTPGAN